MASSSASAATFFRFLPFVALFVVLLSSSSASGQLSTSFYASSCPSLESIVRSVVSNAIAGDPRMGASLVRLFFHDCFVQGCDASILLDDVPGVIDSEKNAFPNVNSVRGYEVIDSIKTAVKNASCNVSCADIVALAARDGTVLLGGPTWAVQLGRRDSTTASRSLANSDLPAPTSSLATLVAAFGNKGLSATDMTALSGAHTFGFARCQTFRARVYNDTNISTPFAKLRQGGCPAAQGSGDANLAPLDVQTQDAFDNAFYANLLKKKGLLHSDQELYNGGSQDALVQQYAANQTLFFADFVSAMVKMGNISPLTGDAGQIRDSCRLVNSNWRWHSSTEPAIVSTHARVYVVVGHGFLRYQPLQLTPRSRPSLNRRRRAADDVVLRVDLPGAGGHRELHRGSRRCRRPPDGRVPRQALLPRLFRSGLRRFHSPGRRGRDRLRRRENRVPERQLRPRLRRHRRHQDERRGQVLRRRLLRRHRRARRKRRHRPARWAKLGRAAGPARLNDGEPEPGQQRPPFAELRPRHAHHSFRQQGPDPARPDGALRRAHRRVRALPQLPRPHLRRHRHRPGVRRGAPGQLLVRGVGRHGRQPGGARRADGAGLRQRVLRRPGRQARPAAFGPGAPPRWRVAGSGVGADLQRTQKGVLRRLRRCYGKAGEHRPAHRNRRRDQGQVQYDQQQLKS